MLRKTFLFPSICFHDVICFDWNKDVLSSIPGWFAVCCRICESYVVVHPNPCLLLCNYKQSQSPAFQRFAVRSSRRMEDLSKMAQQKRQELVNKVEDVSKNFESFKNQ